MGLRRIASELGSGPPDRRIVGFIGRSRHGAGDLPLISRNALRGALHELHHLLRWCVATANGILNSRRREKLSGNDSSREPRYDRNAWVSGLSDKADHLLDRRRAAPMRRSVRER
jgi:hypothetical protein